MPGAPPRIERLEVGAYKVPTEAPQSDGTAQWDHTVLVTVHLLADGLEGFGYTYAPAAAVREIDDLLSGVIEGADPRAHPRLWRHMNHVVRNSGRRGVSACAIAAVDTALWDLRAKALDVPLADMLGRARDAVAAYGSGGFTSMGPDAVARQLGDWVHATGLAAVKMKVGRDPTGDEPRIKAAREAVGGGARLMVDANGAFHPAAALRWARVYDRYAVCWYEEPVSSDDIAGLVRVRDRAPLGMEITAGEYGYEPVHFRRLLENGAVDVLQADATRCMGVSGYMMADALCEAFDVPLSAHTAPALHATLGCASRRTRNIEYFHDHVRIEAMLFAGMPAVKDGAMAPGTAGPGLGLRLRRDEAARFAV